MHSLYKTIHPPTGIDNSVYCNFRSSTENNLITSCSNRLNVYRFYACHVPSDTNDTPSIKNKLELVESFLLYGTISSIKSCRYGNMNKDSLIIAFKDAKLSIVEYDQKLCDLITLSIHFFEDELDTEGIHYNIYDPILKVDPNMRCACMLIYGFKLVVIPFTSSHDATEINDDNYEENSKSLSSYTIDLKKVDNWLEMRIIDIEFLHGYYEPTLFILCESNMTWVGRYAIKKDTCNSVALSLNLNQRTHPIIWPVEKLPSDCLKCYAVPDPIGGVLIFAVNSLIYINQSVPSYAVSLNSIARNTSHYPFKTHFESLRITLDSSQALFISHNKICISLKGGELYVITLLTDSESLRSIRSFDIEKCVNSVISTGMTKCFDDYLFVGSRLGNSILLKFSYCEPEIEQEKLNSHEALILPKKNNDNCKQQAYYLFEICDVLLNIAPCGDSIIGESAGDLSEYASQDDPLNSIHLNHIDIVTTSGHTKNGSISVLQRSIRPDIIATFQIPDIIDIWSVNFFDSSSELNEYAVNYLFLSKIDSTVILQIGNEITELDKESCDFATKEPTLFVTNMQMNKYIVQVTINNIYIYKKESSIINVIDTFNLKKLTDRAIKSVYVLDTFVGILDENYRLYLLKFDGLIQQIALNLNEPISCFSFYEDKTGILTKSEQQKPKIETDQTKDVASEAKTFYSDTETNHIDDEDEILYGSSCSDSKLASPNDYINRLLTEKNPVNSNASNLFVSKCHVPKNSSQVKKPSFKLFLVTLDGSLQIYNLNNLKLEFNILNFNHALRMLSLNNSLESGKHLNAQVHEMLIVAHGADRSRPLVLARMEDDLIIYELSENLMLKKLNHEILIRDKKIKRNRPQVQQNERTTETPLVRQFDNLCSFSGFAVIGSSLSSYLVFNTSRNGLTAHPIWKDTTFPIISFTQFKNSSITMSGFIYINNKYDIRICTLPNDDCKGKLQIYYDFAWILKKIQIRQTVNFISYHEESRTYAVSYNQCETTNKLMQLGEEDKEIGEFQKEDNFIYPNKSQFFIQLYNSVEWEELPYGKYQLNEWEHVSCLKIVDLPYEGHTSGLRSYLVVSTIFCYSEDVNSRGRIILFDIIETVPEPDKPLTNTKLKLIYEKEQKGPVTCVDSVNAHLIGCVGQKIFIWEFKNNELIGKAFIDCSFYIHRMITLKDFVLIADLNKSISLIRFQSEYTKLSFVAKDKHLIDIYACEYFVDNSNLGFIASDSESNISIFSYQNESHDTQGGAWLIKKAEFNIGSRINSMFRLKCRVNDTSTDRRAIMAEKRQVTYCTNLDGGIGYLLPISSKTSLRLFMLQNSIIAMKQHYAGLNPKAYRMYRGKRKELFYTIINFPKNVLDGDLLFEFFNMSYPERNEIAKKIKASCDHLLDDLAEVFQLTCHF
ncbi:Cleavage and polyadenylation specificity factor subunit 1 [Brachionus plicatilis]|uniref:Cleavage and polyadenylation specificity factor subunit 1 n=1 Tax=Brachionus plicatilis TaxID=10195 RepID=A0A3M7R967_BRAPC|nr:Cleavage and polyadenylation specificity factor subunit 1 [Brachionus plicatilis]